MPIVQGSFERSCPSTKSQLTRFFSTTETAAQSAWLPTLHRALVLIVDNDSGIVDVPLIHISHCIVNAFTRFEFNETIAFRVASDDVPNDATADDFSTFSKCIFQTILLKIALLRITADLWKPSHLPHQSWREDDQQKSCDVRCLPLAHSACMWNSPPEQFRDHERICRCL